MCTFYIHRGLPCLFHEISLLVTESGIIKVPVRTALLGNLSKNTTAVFIATHCTIPLPTSPRVLPHLSPTEFLERIMDALVHTNLESP